ncbi:hypothetical protein CcaverHIS002_0508430 [Cutaneotrichosporon cavernicola]|uniref:Conserved oligomeric Golgi complex subunit 3 n=1 Tax=Cutaneotrichosporon cavernicola TaxID=279322 RepID=A0AA48QXF7_9TREE|nr:uncharacterized protein CcaverHIS019_0509000 [Cutaneotrichosporon cavernicola]BEI85442.1 hypothetical protein CcaverHIS002_0508430 [Cutaneotrichosporon cavernicola]BEI93272.1 hypothetical protein CcaverHIS019_0509000 [Cutaneotrichosporon cavernicola]
MSRPATPGGFNLRRTPLPQSGAASRAGTPLAAKHVISLGDWEARAPLSDDEVQSITLIKERFSERPLPDKFSQADGSRPGTPRNRQVERIVHSRAGSASAPPTSPGTPVPSGLSQDALHQLAIVTPQQFHDHFAALALSAEHEQDSLYREHLAEISGLREKCDGLIELLREGEGEVGDMLKALEYVEERSESLRGACEDLLEEQTHLLTHTSELAHRLGYFTFLDTAQRMLNNPGNELVLHPDFLPMVQRLDECISYLGENRDFKDAELYLIRYQQCMTRSMTLIRLHFVAAIKALGMEIGRRVSDKSLSETVRRGLVYNRFSSLSASLRPLIAELEQRISANKDELPLILADCHTAYVSVRQALIGPRVAEEIARLDPMHSELVDLTRAGCSYLKQTCQDEFELFKQIFLSGEAQLYGFLEGLCDHLYDHIRPRILHEPSLTVLQEVCTVLQALMVQDIGDDDDDDEVLIFTPSSAGFASPMMDRDDYFGGLSPTSPKLSLRRMSSAVSGTRGGSHAQTPVPRRRRKPLTRLHTEILLKMVLQDAQTRLVFRAQALIQSDVQYYAAKPGDLDYPEKLQSEPAGQPLVRRTVNLSLDDDDDDEPAFLSLPPPDGQETWYPTLRTTLSVLSSLYTHIDEVVFVDLAQEAVLTCRRSLSAAADIIGAKKDKGVDGRLFLVRHLLILKEMTGGLDLGRASRHRDWHGMTDFLRALMENVSSLVGYGRGTPRGDFAPDAKTDLDKELKRACEDLIERCTQAATAPLRAFIDRCTGHLSSHRGKLAEQEWAKPAAVAAVHDEFRKTAEDELLRWQRELMMYLQDEETVRVLVPPAQLSIVDTYRHFHDLVRSEYDFSTAAALSTPSAVSAQLEAPLRG